MGKRAREEVHRLYGASPQIKSDSGELKRRIRTVNRVIAMVKEHPERLVSIQKPNPSPMTPVPSSGPGEAAVEFEMPPGLKLPYDATEPRKLRSGDVNPPNP